MNLSKRYCHKDKKLNSINHKKQNFPLIKKTSNSLNKRKKTCNKNLIMKNNPTKRNLNQCKIS